MNSEEIKKLGELVVKNWKINKFAYLMADANDKYPFFEKLKLKIKLSKKPNSFSKILNSSFDESKHVDMTKQEALCALVQGRLDSGTDKGGLKALDAHLKRQLKTVREPTHSLSQEEVKTITSKPIESNNRFADDYFHQLVLRAMNSVYIETKKTNWNKVKIGLKKNCLNGESIKSISGYNVEGDSVKYINFKAPKYVEPYKIRESYFKKTLSEYRKHLKKSKN